VYPLFSLSLDVCLRLLPDCRLDCVSFWIDLVLVLVLVGLELALFVLPSFRFTPRAVWDWITTTIQFLDIRSGTRDLTRHLEDLSSQYPVKLVERACLRFCEALARWRGKPELEKVSPHLHSTF
jgi:hypothetical protein